MLVCCHSCYAQTNFKIKKSSDTVLNNDSTTMDLTHRSSTPPHWKLLRKVTFLSFFSLCLAFFAFFALNFSLRLDLIIFLRNETKRGEIQVYFVAFVPFFHFFRFFSLFFAYFTFVFASDFWCFASKWIMWNQAFFRFQAKRNFCFNFKFRFQSESEGAPYSPVVYRRILTLTLAAIRGRAFYAVMALPIKCFNHRRSDSKRS